MSRSVRVLHLRRLDHLKKALLRHGIKLEGTLTDNGPEFIGKHFQTKAADPDWSITGSRPDHRTPTRCANGSTAPSSTSPTGRTSIRGGVDDIPLLNRSLQAWLVDYGQHRPNHGNYMAGRTPLEVKKQLRRRVRKTAY